MHLLTYFNISTGKISPTVSGSSFTLPQFIQGDEVVVGLRLTEQAEGASFETSRAITSIKASLGFVDQRPSSGYFVLRNGDGPFVEGQNQTRKIAHSAFPSEVSSALSEIGITGTSVNYIDGSWIVEKGGQQIELTGASAAGSEIELLPLSFVSVRELSRAGKYQYEIRLIQSPLASTVNFSRIVPPAPSIREIQEGGSEATTVWPEIQALTLPPSFRGTYQIVRGFRKTGELSLEDGPEEIEEALSRLADPGGKFIVTNPTTNVAHITFDGSMTGIPQDELVVEVFSAPEGDPTFVLDLNTAEVAAALRKSDSVKPSLEIEITYEDVNDSNNTITTSTQRNPVTLVRDLNWNGLEAAANIDWLRPPHGESYVPFRLDQIITGTQNYVSALGDGETSTFVVSHNLGTLNILPPTLRDNVTGAILTYGQDWTVTASTENTVTVSVSGPARPVAGLLLVLGTAGPSAVFQAHTHTIEQVNGLSIILSDLGGRVETLENLLPGTSPAVSASASAGPVAAWDLPKPFIVMPTRSDISGATDVKSIKEAQLPRSGGLLPAVYTNEETVSVASLPASPVVGNIYRLSSGEITLPGYLGRRSTKITNDDKFTWDGRGFYRVAKIVESDAVYYPTDFDIELFRVPVSEKQLRLGRTFRADFSLVAALFNSNVSAQWGVVIDIGIPTKEGSGAANLFSVDWLEPSLDQTFLVSSVPSAHSFGIRISRKLVGGVDTLVVGKILYNAEEFCPTVITSNNFVVRARLSRFDTSNNLTDPRGLLAFNGLDATLGSEPEDGSTFGKAEIN